MIRWHPNKIHFPISSSDTSKLLQIHTHIHSLLAYFHIHPSTHSLTHLQTYTYTQRTAAPRKEEEKKHTTLRYELRHLFETNNIASTVNKQHQIAFYFVPFILFCDASTSTIHHSLCTSVRWCGGTVTAVAATVAAPETAAMVWWWWRRPRHTSQFVVFQTHIVPYIFAGVFGCRLNSFWSSLVRRSFIVVAVIHGLVAFAIYVVVCVLSSFLFIFFFLPFVPFSFGAVRCGMVVDGYCEQSTECHLPHRRDKMPARELDAW